MSVDVLAKLTTILSSNFDIYMVCSLLSESSGTSFIGETNTYLDAYAVGNLPLDATGYEFWSLNDQYERHSIRVVTRCKYLHKGAP